MRARECSHLLHNDHRCRCAAIRNQPWCRHHAPKPAVAGPPPLRARDRYSRLSHWADVGRNLPWTSPEEIPGEIYDILFSLLQDDSAGISDRQAGRLLRGFLRRLGSVPFAIPDDPSAPVAPDPSASSDDPTGLDRLVDSLQQCHPGLRAAMGRP